MVTSFNHQSCMVSLGSEAVLLALILGGKTCFNVTCFMNLQYIDCAIYICLLFKAIHVDSMNTESTIQFSWIYNNVRIWCIPSRRPVWAVCIQLVLLWPKVILEYILTSIWTVEGRIWPVHWIRPYLTFHSKFLVLQEFESSLPYT